jgi:hypothetical protein
MTQLILGASLLLALVAGPAAGHAVPLAQSSSLASVKRVMTDPAPEQDVATPRLPRN